jgi:signal transduction histidine kinase
MNCTCPAITSDIASPPSLYGTCTISQKGTGLGLAVVQQIILAHGWEIACAATEPRGAEFRISHLKTVA